MDEFGHKLMTTGTTRPPGFPADDWKRLSVNQRERAIAEYREAKEEMARIGGGPPAVLPIPPGLPRLDGQGLPLHPRHSHGAPPPPPPHRGRVARVISLSMTRRRHPSR